MLRAVLTFFFLAFQLAAGAQEVSGTWVMAYIKAKQPVFTMIQENGRMRLEDETPRDSTVIYSPGLMWLQFFDRSEKARSFSWDGEERWRVSIRDQTIQLLGEKDTLFGTFDSSRLVLQSTIDQIPTYYFFEPVTMMTGSTDNWDGTSWKASLKDHYFHSRSFHVEKDSIHVDNSLSILPENEFYTHDLGEVMALEYVLNPSVGPAELGIIYLCKKDNKRLIGIFYPVIDESIPPKRKEMLLRKTRR